MFFGGLTLNCGNCGTAYRFLTAFLACKSGSWILDGSERMQQRPIKELVETLRNAGADITYLKKDSCPPLQIRGRQLRAERWTIDARRSSQYVSALAMILPLMQRNSEIEFLTDGNSLQYIDMTIKLMQRIGLNINRIDNKITYIEASREKIPVSFFVEYDWSAAAVWFVFAALTTDADFFIKGLKKSELQADSIIAEWAELFGVQTEYMQNGVRLTNTGNRHFQNKISLDCRNNPDLVPYLASICVGLKREAVLENVQNLTIKESNRIEVLIQELGKIAFLEYRDNSLIINPIQAEFPNTISFSSHNDHRIAMSLWALSALIPQVQIDDMDCVRKSYPGFNIQIPY
jgi:3-phosphoshikimate 1-carboxyvinyltransferase